MARDYINIGSVPCDEDCAQVGSENYHSRSRAECNRFIALLRKKFGMEPEGAKLEIKWFQHDFGQYAEVVCWFEEGNQKAEEYAFKCEAETPAKWED